MTGEKHYPVSCLYTHVATPAAAPNASLWRNRDFMKLWTGQTVSELGSRITRDGLPLAAVMVLHAGPLEMGFLRAIGGAAALILGLYAGLWVDRLRRRPIMILADIGRALCLAVIPIAAFTHRLNMSLLYIVTAIAGVLTIFFDVSYQTYVPTLVDREQVLEGNSKLAMSNSLAEVFGPGLTGVLVQLITAPIAILIDAISFLFSAASVALIRKPELRPTRTPPGHPLKEAIAGFTFIRSQPVLRALAGYWATAFFCFGIFSPLYVLYAIRDLRMGPMLWQLAITCGGIANLAGSASAVRISKRLGLGPTLLLGSLGLGLGTLLIPLAHGSVPLATSFIVLSQITGDISFVLISVHEISLRQTLSPENVLGRVNATMRLLTFGLYPLGALAGGFLAAVWGVRSTMFAAAAGTILAAAWLIFSPVRTLQSPVVQKIRNRLS